MKKSTIYIADYVLPMDDDNTLIENGGILVEDGIIKSIDASEELTVTFPHAEVVYLENQLLMPGLINTHCHSGMLRGTAEGLPVYNSILTLCTVCYCLKTHRYLHGYAMQKLYCLAPLA